MYRCQKIATKEAYILITLSASILKYFDIKYMFSGGGTAKPVGTLQFLNTGLGERTQT